MFRISLKLRYFKPSVTFSRRKIYPPYCALFKYSTVEVVKVLKGQGHKIFFYVLLIRFDLCPIWTGKNGFANFIVFVRYSRKHVSAYSRWLYAARHRVRAVGINLLTKSKLLKFSYSAHLFGENLQKFVTAVEMLTRQSSGIDWIYSQETVGRFLHISPIFYMYTRKPY